MGLILFEVAGGPMIGMGHVSRSLALAREMVRRKGTEAVFHTNREPRTLEAVRAHGFKLAPPREQSDTVAEAASVARDLQPDSILFDLPSDNVPLAEALARAAPLARRVALDHFSFDHEWFDVIVNLYNHNQEVPKPCCSSVEYRCGSEFAILRNEFLPFIDRPLPIAPTARRVLVSFGGADPRRWTLLVANAAERIRAQLQFQFVVGPNFEHAEEIAANVSHLPQASLYSNPPNFEQLLSEADLVMSGGGTTMLEACALGTPALVLPQTERERAFAGHLQERGAVCRLDEYTPDSVAAVIVNLAGHAERRCSMAEAGRKAVDGRGVTRVADLLWNKSAEEPAGSW